MANPIVAILGRPNVGKSTLFNRLVGKSHAIVSPIEGITRDRIYGSVEWTGKHFDIIDTGGYLPASEDKIEKAVRYQGQLALDEADLIILLIGVEIPLIIVVFLLVKNPTISSAVISSKILKFSTIMGLSAIYTGSL